MELFEITAWKRWLNGTTDSDSTREIARRAGISHQTVSRWLRDDTCPAHGVIAIARAYEADPIEGMIAAGWLNEADLTNGALRNAVRVAPTAYLTDELNQRATAGQVADGFDRLRRMLRAWA